MVSNLLGMFFGAFLAQMDYIFGTFLQGLLKGFLTVLGTWFQDMITQISAAATWIDQDVSVGASTPGSFGDTLDRFYNLVKPTGLILVGAAAAVRISRLAFEHKAPGQAVILDVIPRAGIGFIAIMVAGDPVLHFAAHASHELGRAFLTLFFSQVSGAGAITLVIFQLVMMVVGIIVFAALASTGVGLTIAIPILLLFLFTVILIFILEVYLVVLWIGRAIILLFCFATAPICLACAVYDMDNRFTKWWVNQLTNALILPSVLAIGLGVTISATTIVAGIGSAGIDQIVNAIINGGPIDLKALAGAAAFTNLGTSLFRVLIANIILIGGMWYTGKVVHALIKETYSHGGILGGIKLATEMAGTLFVADRFARGAGAAKAALKGGGGAAAVAASGVGAGTGGGSSASPIGSFNAAFAQNNPAWVKQSGGTGTPAQQGSAAFQAYSQQDPGGASTLMSAYLGSAYGSWAPAPFAPPPGAPPAPAPSRLNTPPSPPIGSQPSWMNQPEWGKLTGEKSA